MRILLDTHLLIWAVEGPHRLSAAALAAMGDDGNDLVLSVASVWEVAIKFALRRPEFSVDPRLLRRELLEYGCIELPVSAGHALATISLPPIHRDPFDRILVAQAQVEGIILLTADATIARYPGPIRLV